MAQNTTNRKRILLSDSSSLLLTVRESILQTSQVSPLIASSAPETMALVRLWHPDLLILGPMDVSNICETLKSSKDFRDIPLIGIIGNRNSETREKVLAAGCDDWISTPLDEDELLTKIQDLTGLRFRKLPRYSYNAPALVSFKRKDFTCKSVDINRRMIFLESKEGMAPAVGRNVRLNFQLTKQEPISCWGRVVRLMARKLPHEERETIGMLIQFLDLSLSTAKRIEDLALQQISRAQYDSDEPLKDFAWLEPKDYLEIAKSVINGNDSARTNPLAFPTSALKAYVNGLSDAEKDTLKSSETDSLLGRTVLGRIKFLDDLTKFRYGSSLHRLKSSIEEVEKLQAEVQGQLGTFIDTNDEAEILTWSKIKFDIVRTLVEMEAIQKGQSSFSSALRSAESKHTPHHWDWKAFTLGILVALALLFMPRIFGTEFGHKSIETINLSKIETVSKPLQSAQIIRLNSGNWKVFHGQLNTLWPIMTLLEKQKYCKMLKMTLQPRKVTQIFLFGPGGELQVGIINDKIEFFKAT